MCVYMCTCVKHHNCLCAYSLHVYIGPTSSKKIITRTFLPIVVLCPPIQRRHMTSTRKQDTGKCMLKYYLVI